MHLLCYHLWRDRKCAACAKCSVTQFYSGISGIITVSPVSKHHSHVSVPSDVKWSMCVLYGSCEDWQASGFSAPSRSGLSHQFWCDWKGLSSSRSFHWAHPWGFRMETNTRAGTRSCFNVWWPPLVWSTQSSLLISSAELFLFHC